MGRGGSRKIGGVKGLESQFNDVLSLLEKSLGSVEGKSRLGEILKDAQQAAFGADPMLKQLYDVTSAGLDQGGYGGLPSDFASQLQSDVRASQAARGVIDSSTSAIEEGVRMLGGRENIRNQRIAQAEQLLTSGLVPTANQFIPSTGDLLNASMGVQQMKLNRNIARKQAGSNALQAQSSYLGSLGSLFSSVSGSNSSGSGIAAMFG